MRRSYIYQLNSFLHKTLVAELFFALGFYILYLLLADLPLTFVSLVKVHWQNPALFFLPLFFVGIYLLIYLEFHKIRDMLKEDEEELAKYKEKEEQIYKFIEALREWRTDYEVSAVYQKDRLFQALVNLRDEMRKAREEEEQRKKEDKQRQWVSEGLAKFGAILRENVDDLQKLTEEITRNLTKYVKVEQAAFFLIKEEEGKKYLEMTAFFAFDRKKFPDKRFEWGEGLIGAVAIEKKTLYLKETSNDFVEITSGLGGANPRTIVITPVKDQDGNVHGVIELASFKILEDFEIEFIEQVAESTGATIANIKINLRTQELLKESQKQAEQLAQQEETLRRSIAELEELQKQAAVEREKFLAFQHAVDETFIKAEFSLEGEIILVNNKFVEKFEFVNELEAQNVHYSTLLNIQNIDWFNDVWNNKIIKKKEAYIAELQFISRKNNIIWLHLALAPQTNQKGEVTSVLLLAFDITEQRNKEQELEEIFETFNKTFYKAEFRPDGTFISFNQNLLNLFNVDPKDLFEKTVFDIFQLNTEEFKINWNNVLSGKTLKDRFSVKCKKTGKEFFLDAYLSPIFVYSSTPVKIVMVASDATPQVQLEKKLEDLKAQLQNTEDRLKNFQEQFNKQLEAKTEELKKQNTELEQITELLNSVIDFTGNHLIVLSKEKRIIYVNTLVEKLWKSKRQVIIGRRLTFLLPDIQDFMQEKNYMLNLIDDSNVDKTIDAFIADKEMNKIPCEMTLKKYKDNYIILFRLK